MVPAPNNQNIFNIHVNLLFSFKIALFFFSKERLSSPSSLSLLEKKQAFH